MSKLPINSVRKEGVVFDKILLKFFADLLYVKNVIYYEELEAILNACTLSDLDEIFERMMRDGFSPYKRGEYYSEYEPEENEGRPN